MSRCQGRPQAARVLGLDAGAAGPVAITIGAVPRQGNLSAIVPSFRGQRPRHRWCQCVGGAGARRRRIGGHGIGGGGAMTVTLVGGVTGPGSSSAALAEPVWRALAPPPAEFPGGELARVSHPGLGRVAAIGIHESAHGALGEERELALGGRVLVGTASEGREWKAGDDRRRDDWADRIGRRDRATKHAAGSASGSTSAARWAARPAPTCEQRRANGGAAQLTLETGCDGRVLHLPISHMCNR